MLGLLWKLLPWSIFLVVLERFFCWAYLTFTAGKVDLSAFGSRSRRAWCIITGSTDGIGLGLAQELAKHKFNLFLVGRNPEKLAAVKSDLLNSNPQIKIVTIVSEASDVSFENVNDGVVSVVEKTLATEKGTLRMLINNVGIGWGRKCRLGDIREDEEVERIEEIVLVNCTYPVQLTRAVLKLIRNRTAAGDYAVTDRLAIVNMASCAALTPATPFSALYSATKAFNRSFSNSLAGELTARRLLHPELSLPQIQVLCVNPGFVVSALTGMKESFICCSARSHAQVVLRKLAWPWSMDIIPHWKHGLMWAALCVFDWLVPVEWVLVGVLMPWVLKFSGKFRNFKID